MNRTDTGREAEELYLRETLRIIDTNLANYRQEVTRMQADIDEMLEHYHDNDTEVWTILNNTITLNEHMKRALARNERAKQKPYFGRIIFHDETLNREESLYIGKGGISADRTSQRVVDWRAPVANAYYENGLGKCSYTAPDGKELPIDLKLKRTYELAEGRLLDYFDTEVVANDDLLMKYLSKNKEAVLGEIVATIQKEQNEIIRKSPYHNIIVQGVAGSGKTTVAMHRISFILYNYQERFRPEDFYIVGSNRILLNYITGVLPDLDVYGVKQMTMEQLFIRLLYEDWDAKKYEVKSLSGAADIVKGTEMWYRDLIAFIRRLEQKTIPQESIFLNPRQFVEGLQNGKNGIYDKTEEDRRAGRKPVTVRLVEAESTKRYIAENPSVSIQSKIHMLNERLTVKIKEEFLGKGVKYTAEERKAILRAYRGYYGKAQWKTSIYELYQQFLLEQRKKGYSVTLPENAFDVYDLAALALLYKLVKETEVISEAHHIVIDEAQDFGMMAYHVLHDCIRDCTYTVMGDISQNIRFGSGLNDWEELKALLLTDPADSFGVLKKSYRNTVEISDFATAILRHGRFLVYPVEPIIRHGKPVAVELSSKKTFALRAAEICRRWQSEGLKTIAVVCRDAASANRTAAALAEQIPILESDLTKADFGNGILVLPVEYTKGLEFDAVLIWNPTREDYPSDDGHAKLLYVAATRALHELHILHDGNLTGLIADPVPENRTQRPADVRTEPSGKQADAGNREANPDNIQNRTVYKAPTTEMRPRVKPRIVIATAKPDAAFAKAPAQTIRTFSKTASAIAQQKKSVPVSGNALSFGDMPPTEALRPEGHAKISLAVRWASRQPDGLYLQSQYGILRISPVGSAILRLTFSKAARITDTVHPLIRVNRQERDWKFKDNGRQLTLTTKELCVEIDKASGSARYLDPTGKALLNERKAECRQIEGQRNRIFFDWQKGEQLYALGPSGQDILKLRGSARVLSVPGQLPFVLSDRGYAILPATTGTVISCDIAAYGSYLSMEGQEQQDYYLIVGREQNIRNAYAYLTGNL